MALVIKDSPANAGEVRDIYSTPGSGISLGEEHGNSLQYSCLENLMDRTCWWTTVHGVEEGPTLLNRLSTAHLQQSPTHSCPPLIPFDMWPIYI